MRKLNLVLLFVFVYSYSFAQSTKILDSNVDWSSGSKQLVLYMSDSLATAINIKMGSALDGSDVLNVSYTVGAGIFINDNMLVVPLSGINPGEYYVEVSITLPDASIRKMQYQTSN